MIYPKIRKHKKIKIIAYSNKHEKIISINGQTLSGRNGKTISRWKAKQFVEKRKKPFSKKGDKLFSKKHVKKRIKKALIAIKHRKPFLLE